MSDLQTQDELRAALRGAGHLIKSAEAEIKRITKELEASRAREEHFKTWLQHANQSIKDFVIAATEKMNEAGMGIDPPERTYEAHTNPIEMKEAQRFRKKPVVIEAIEWTGKNLFDVITFTDGEPDLRHDMAADKWGQYCELVRREGFKIKTLEGYMDASIGDMIIKGVQGELYPCKPDIFAETYEPSQ